MTRDEPTRVNCEEVPSPATGRVPSEGAEIVTVVIPTYARANLTDRAVRSVLAQTYPAIELVIVDDASPVPYAVPGGEPRRGVAVRLLRLDANSGPGAAREAGRRVATGAYVSYLDSDDFWAPRFLDVLVTALRASPGAGMAYCASVARKGGNVVEVFRSGDPTCVQFLPTVLWSRPWATSSCVWRRSAVDAIGDWLPLRNWEDKEYDVRAGCHEVAIVHRAEALCFVQVDAPDRLSIRKPVEDARSFALAHLAIARNLERTAWRRDPEVWPRIVDLFLDASILCSAQGERSLMLQAITGAWRWSESKGRLAALIGVSSPVLFLGTRSFTLRVLRWLRRIDQSARNL